MSGITFDAGGLIALDRNDHGVLARIACTVRATVAVNHSLDGAASGDVKPCSSGTDLIVLDGPGATAVGLLLARTATHDIVDAHVAVCARNAGQALITSAPADLRRIAPELQLLVV